MEDIFSLWITLTLTFFMAMWVHLVASRRRSLRKQVICETSQMIPTPPRVPILGHLHLLHGEPFVQMSQLAQKYGNIFRLQLGSVDAVVVNSFGLMKEILIEKGSDFGDRPNFLRYNVLFGGDKENSLAFCDWSKVQKTRRALARKACHTGLFASRIDAAVEEAGNCLVKSLCEDLVNDGENAFKGIKYNLQVACANVFFDFFCSETYDGNKDLEFKHVVTLFDDIFWEINQGHATDVLPMLSSFFHSHLSKVASMGKSIRTFVIERIINPHMKVLDPEAPKDFVDVLLTHLHEGQEETLLTMEQVLYELEDFIGGHSAISNLLARSLIEIGSTENLSMKIYQKHFVDGNTDFIQAVIYETLRKTSSPIVPHVASADTNIGGYDIKKGTMMILNNYDLNTNEAYWDDPEKFLPERFLDAHGTFKRPSHFWPFSNGKRACMGYRLVEIVTKGLIAAIIKTFDIVAMENPTTLPISCVAIDPSIDLRIKLIPRILK